jgi:uncharacterized protein
MDCPVCHVTLLMTERLGVEIDHCPKCRGVWLDRGELDKILDRSLDGGGDQGRDDDDRGLRRDHDRESSDWRDHDREHGRPRGRRSLLRELFD